MCGLVFDEVMKPHDRSWIYIARFDKIAFESFLKEKVILLISQRKCLDWAESGVAFSSFFVFFFFFSLPVNSKII